MSRLTTLIAQARAKDPDLAAALESEFRALSSRRQFGLNFERHQPEAVEIPDRPIRKGDKVRVLPPRGSTEKGDQRLWRVTKLANVEGGRVAHLVLHDVDEPETQVVTVEDLVVVAEFRDPIYPGLRSTGRVERGGDKPFHTVINAENFHALQTLTYTHRGKVDAIYIDPPYNTGARDWKYNNNYVDADDAYRHSKWLAFMERRLKLAKQLLNPRDSVLIVTIDEKEYLRLGLLLEQIFPEAKMQMISSVINPRGIVRDNEFSRSNEFIFFLWFGSARIAPEGIEESQGAPVAWETMRRRSKAGARGRKGPGACGPNQFYAIHVDEESGHIVGRGEALPLDFEISDYKAPPGCVAVFPCRDDGTEMNWSLKDTAFDERWSKGYVRAGKATPDKPQKYIIQYILGGVIDDIEAGRARIVAREDSGAVVAEYVEEKARMPHTQWDKPSHNAQQNGTGLLSQLLPDRGFPYAKSLYAVEDSLNYFVKSKPNALVLDFFAGSGTTAHATMRLNRTDGGRRQCISITNNEVGASEADRLRADGSRPGDIEWEALGICDFITRPRITAAVTGISSTGGPAEGNYKYNDVFPVAEGLCENVEFFTLTYETPWRVARNRDFTKIAPLLWLRAGSEGRRIDTLPAEGWAVADTYCVIADLDRDKEFQAAVAAADSVKVAYIVTDDDRRFQMVAGGLPDRVEPVRLYESYLNNFEINTGRE